MALNVWLARNWSVRAISAECGLNYRKLLAFSRGGAADFDAAELDRLAAFLRLRVVPGPPAPEPSRPDAPAPSLAAAVRAVSRKK
jgi:hypothetical protein